ncbi:unnamed protein product [Vitrella brassicaformis CCMP3155]|uniref:Uncharacterized protein n=1 Tax=Vitrella brassicaformis (strain CCMP3155) TaxID=1169540 RepID=A0A0G4FXY5_VITBC|nr:unnamed protein product [Vitrella brassicaformis CCMP3155]|eukprot:CEM20291.1 unnamed protein product [Vitrella brassicaformis CCMP3155]
MASSSSSGQMTHPQAAVGASPCRYRVGSRVLMVSERRRDDKFQWVEAEVYKIEPAEGGTRVCIREVGGMNEEFEPVVVPHTTAAFQQLPDLYAGGHGFHYFDHTPPQHLIPLQTVDEADAERFCVDPSIKPRDAEDPLSLLFLPPSFMPPLPTDIITTTLLPLCGGRETLALKLKSTLCCTSTEVGNAIGSAAVSAIDSIIETNGLTCVIGYTPLRRSTGVRRPFRLIRLDYLMVTGGDWTGSVPVLRFAKSCGRVQSLPIDLTNDDLQEVGSKAIIDSRPEAIRQYALFSHRLGDRMRLRREMMGEYVVTVHTRQTVPAEYRDRFDAADPPCRYNGDDFGSFTGLVILWLAVLSSREVSYRSYSRYSAGYRRIGGLIDQQSPLWGGCRTVYGFSGRLVILCGDREGDDFAACIRMFKYSGGSARIIMTEWHDVWASISLHTTEAPQGCGSGPAAFQRAVAIARNKLGDAITLLPKVNEAITTAGGLTEMESDSGTHDIGSG